MNREALFCDGTGDYVCPAEPEINEKVVLRFRTAHNDVDEVKLHIGEQEYPMWKTRTDGRCHRKAVCRIFQPDPGCPGSCRFSCP